MPTPGPTDFARTLGRKDDPLYKARTTLQTGRELLTEKQIARLEKLFASEKLVEVEVIWWIYLRIVAAYRHAYRARGRELRVQLITTLSQGVPRAMAELVTLGRT